MKTVSAMTMRRHFGGLLDAVHSKSEPVLIERGGKPMAVLAPLPGYDAAKNTCAGRLAALERMTTLTKSTARGRDAQAWVAKERNGWSGRSS